MAKGRAAAIFSILLLAVACLHSVVGVKVYAEVASLNETAHHDDDIVEENEVPLSHKSENKTDVLPHEHPHNMPGKPTKFDIELHVDDKADYQIEPTRMANVTANPIEMNSTTSQSNSTKCRGKLTVSCIRKNFSNFLDQLSRVDTYNVTKSVQIIRNPEANVACNDRKKGGDPDLNLLDKIHHYARTHVMKIQLNEDLNLAGKARTFFGCEFLNFATNFFACVLVPLLLSTRKVDFLKLRYGCIRILSDIVSIIILMCDAYLKTIA